MFFFGKVGGGTPTGIIPIDTPNDVDALPGEKIDLYFYNEAPDGSAPNQWEKYGTGTVSPDGTRILTDINPTTGKPYGIPRFCCGGRRNVPPPPPPRPGGGPSGGPGDGGDPGGEPVDLATGFFYLTKTDLVLPGILPLVVTRTYRTNLTNAGPFGLGTSWPYDLFLQPPPNGSSDALILFTPGNRQDLFARQPDGTFTNTTSPALRGAVVTVTSGGRTLRYKDGRLFGFDSSGRLISQADRNGNTVTIVRDGQGRVTTLIEPRGRSLTVSYTGTNLQIDQVTDPLGRTVSYAYDASNRLTTVTDPAGGVTRYTYDAAGRMLTLTDPRSITFLTNAYDGQGRVCRQTQADGGIWLFYYVAADAATTVPAQQLLSQAAAGGPITAPPCTVLGTAPTVLATVVVDPRGNPTTHRFNSAGYLISKTDALGQTTRFDRQPGTNLLLSTTDPLGRVTRFTYDAQGNVISITDPAGNVRTVTYDVTFSRITSFTDPLGNVTTFRYDPSNGDLLQVIDPLGASTQFAYNAAGQRVAMTDPLGNTTTFGYNARGDLVSITDPLGNTTTREHDPVSRLIRQTDPRGQPTSFEYDALDRLGAMVDALSGTTSFAYDPIGKFLTLTDARGNTTRHEYDAMGRLARRRDPLGAGETFSYDAAGNLVSATDRKGQVTTFEYDPRSRRRRASYADGTVATFQFDAAGRLVEAADAADPHGPIGVAYDALGRVVAETTALGAVSYEYDLRGRRTRMAVGGQAPVAYTYDPASRLRSISRPPLDPVTMDYDALGRRTLLTLPNGVTTEYQYDAASRLTALTYRNATGLLGNLQYSYDATGNRIGVSGSFARTLLPDPVPLATYDAANRQVQFGDRQMTFDANGSLTTLTDPAGTITFLWDPRDRLRAVTGPGDTATFAYDGVGRRAQKTVKGQTTSFQYDAREVVREVLDGTPADLLRGLRLDEPLVRAEGGGSAAYLRDGLGSVLALTEAAGTLTTQYTYGPFGQTGVTGGPSTNPFQYAAREHDGTGLYYFRARYYHPGLLRFLGEDPLGFGGGFANLYVYVGNNPLILVDLTGLDPTSDDEPRVCVGRARVLLGNSRHIGRVGAFRSGPGRGIRITSGSAVIIPGQFGGLGTAGIRPFAGQISGTVVGQSDPFTFTDVADVIGPASAQEKLQRLNPGTLIIELPGGEKDLGITGIVILVPQSLPCPTGTTEGTNSGP